MFPERSEGPSKPLSARQSPPWQTSIEFLGRRNRPRSHVLSEAEGMLRPFPVLNPRYHLLMPSNHGAYTIHPLTPDRWDDFETLFGTRGAYSGCWCMWWRVTGQEFSTNKNAGNRAAIKTIVQQGPPPGLLAYRGKMPVGWLSLGPRSDFGRIERSPLFKAIDGTQVWSIVCFFIHKDHRRRGVARALLDAAIDYAQNQGAPALEAYPIDVAEANESQKADPNLFTGTADFFARAGFEVVQRSKPARPMMRKALS